MTIGKYNFMPSESFYNKYTYIYIPTIIIINFVKKCVCEIIFAFKVIEMFATKKNSILRWSYFETIKVEKEKKTFCIFKRTTIGI